MTIRNQQRYIQAYKDRLDKAYKDMVDDGIEDGDSHQFIDSEGGFKAKEIVGYYLSTYEEFALYMWLQNSVNTIYTNLDREINRLFLTAL